MHKIRIFGALIVTLIFCLCLVGTAMAGPGTVEVTVPGDITLRMGAQVRFIPTSEIDRDFGLSDDLSGTEEKRAAAGLGPAIGVLADSPRVHLTEGAGAVKDSYVRNENRLFFNFAKAEDWDVYMMLESDFLWDRGGVDRTDFAWGRQSQQFGIERLNASFNLPWVSSRLRGGWDARGIDIGYGGFIYGDDDPGLGLVGGADSWKWEVWWIKKDENEAGYAGDVLGRTDHYVMSLINPIGPPVQDKDADRDFYYGKLGYDFGNRYLEGFYMLHRNRIGGVDIDHNIAGVQGHCTHGIIHPMFEVAHAFGDYDNGESMDIDSWGAFADVEFDLSEKVGMKKFAPHVGAYYLQGDDDATDDNLEGWAEVVGISRFTPRYGSEQAIVHDGNALLGSIEYSMFPAYYGQVRGAGINGLAAFDNPGFTMFGGGIDAGWGRWSYNGNVMAMWFTEEKAVQSYYEDVLGLTNVDIDDFMGVEWNNELSYKLYDAVTLKLGAAWLFPGSGAEDITQALDAYAREQASFDQGRSSDDISMRFAAELLWFF